MNIVEPILFQARNKPSEVALAAPGTPLNLVSYARLVAMVSNACHRLEISNLRAGDRVELKVGDPLLNAIFIIALARLGVIILSSVDAGYNWPFEVTAVVSNSPHKTFAGRHILIDYEWVAESPQKSVPNHYHLVQPSDLCCVFAEPDAGMPASTFCFSLSHELLSARIGRQDVFFGASVSAAPRLFAADGCATSLGFQLLFSTLSRGASLFLLGDEALSFNALDNYQVESAVMTPKKLIDLIAFYEAKVVSQCGLKTIFVVGHVSKSIIERASRTLGAKISFGYYFTQPGMIASMPFHGAEIMNNAVGVLLPGVTAEVVRDDGLQVETSAAGKIRFRSDLSAGIYGDCQKGGYYLSNDKGYLTEEGILMLENLEAVSKRVE